MKDASANLHIVFEDIGLCAPQVLLPRPEIDLGKWAVVACDQYTSQPEYWEDVAARVTGSPSTLNLVLPEVYLGTPAEPELRQRISRTMRDYLDSGVFRELPPGFVLVERRLSGKGTRTGLLAALDLEHYDFRPDAQTLVRATEGTIVDRLPPRVQVREQALLELPHIMVLIDDPDLTVIEPLRKRDLPVLYETALMKGGGEVRGRHVRAPADLQQVARSLRVLADPAAFERRHARGQRPVLVYAMGDGNHSLAAARVVWEQIRDSAPRGAVLWQHPARYALVELVNLHDPGLAFEPIHRVLFGSGPEHLRAAMAHFFQARGEVLHWQTCADAAAAASAARVQGLEGLHSSCWSAGGRYGTWAVAGSGSSLAAATLQGFLDRYCAESPEVRLDYVHGREVVDELSRRPGNVGFYLEPLSKTDFFKTIVFDGAFPRKTFSLGEPEEKRYYLEARRIV